MKPFDIAPFSLPNCGPGEFRFEEPRDIRQIVLTFRKQIPRSTAVHYLQDKWPRLRVEEHPDLEDPARFGWLAMDDWFNGTWRQARVRRSIEGRTAVVSFQAIAAEELPGAPADYAAEFRRTLGTRLEVPDWSQVARVAVHTCSAPVRTRLRVELDAGRKAKGRLLELSGYNARILAVAPLSGVKVEGSSVVLGQARRRAFEISVEHMRPAHRYAHDDGHVLFSLEHERFTISLESLREDGPIWYAEEGIFITRADDPIVSAEYRKDHASATTIAQRVVRQPEQSYAGAHYGQPRPHAVAYSFGCKHSPQRYWLEPNGDLLLHKHNLERLDQPGQAAARYAAKGNARFLFGLDRWRSTARYTDPAPAPVCNLHFARGDVLLEQKSLAVPLSASILDGEPGYDAVVVALLRFRFTNSGPEPAEARLEVRFSEESRRSQEVLRPVATQDEHRVPRSPLTPLAFQDGRLTSQHQDRQVLRAACATSMVVQDQAGAVVLRQTLQPGQTCQIVLKVPYLALESAEELTDLERLDFDTCLADAARYWRRENLRGSQLRSSVPQLDALYAAHQTHVAISDIAMPDDPDLVNTSVGTSTYGNFSNESCMIVQELDQRGLHDECRRRLDLWVKYQGSVPQPGNFADHQGMFYGAGGFEQGHYNQHHGWVLWALADHYLVTRDREWFARTAPAVIAGADWVYRQRRLTMRPLPHSRGWECGFLPAGSLEDVTEFYYWLSTNSLTWRGTDSAARALEAFGHPEAGRVRHEADAYRGDLVRGFETLRQHAPLVRLRDGRWVPQYPSRLYCRGRDQGWLRQVLEGAVYLLVSGLYDTDSKAAGWILDDYHDNLYLNPPYGYALRDPDTNYFNRGGFSIQPCLLAGLMPHLDRDEPEVYLWMLFNALASIFREEINGCIEHPMPELGFSNSVVFKTSDEANAVMWLRYLYVYWRPGLLHFGRALPRAWFAQTDPLEITRVSTLFGEVAVRYQSSPERGRIAATVELGELRDEPQVLLRFRTPAKSPISAARVDGQTWNAFDPVKGDVDLTGLGGRVEVEVEYQ